MKKYNYAVLKTPSNNIIGMQGIEDLSYSELLKQHDTLQHFLKNIGIKVHSISSSRDNINYLNINELCITTRRCAIFTNIDDKIVNNFKVEVATHLSRFYPLDRIHYINFPATVSGRDIVVVNDTYYVSISELTNQEGAEELKKILSRYNFKVIIVNQNIDSLKNNINYIEHNNLLIKEGFTLPSEFREFNLINVNMSEENGIGSIWVNDTIIIPNNCEDLKSRLNMMNKYIVVGMNDSEIRKLKLCLNNLALLF